MLMDGLLAPGGLASTDILVGIAGLYATPWRYREPVGPPLTLTRGLIQPRVLPTAEPEDGNKTELVVDRHSNLDAERSKDILGSRAARGNGSRPRPLPWTHKFLRPSMGRIEQLYPLIRAR